MPVFRWMTRALAALLLGSHAWLLATQWQAGRLTEPALLLRWAAAIAIAVSLRAMYRSGVSPFSRKSMVIWLLAALLHGPAIASRTGAGVELNALPEAAMTLALQTAAVAGTLTLTVLLVAAVIYRRALAAPRAWAFIADLGVLTPLADGFSAVVSARPPPARA